MEDTIAAIATAYGEGSIGIIRLSGERSLTILERIFRQGEDKKEKQIVNRRLTYGHIVNPREGRVIDEVLSVFMKAPHSYTTEDVVEIQCHGSIVALRQIFALVLEEGARPAEPGEFTKRAFLNGRIDLSQAEAVIDLVRAKSDEGYRAALSQLSGGISFKVREIRSVLLNLLVDITVNLDYPDEDIEELTYRQMKSQIEQATMQIDALLATADTGRVLREGLRVAIVGRPNVGKSSLMNALLRESRAIVTEIEGTTRDTIEEVMTLQGIPLYLIDTAGIRETDNAIEKIGIERSREALQRADLILFMVDGSKKLQEEDAEIAAQIEDRPVILLVNKKDLGREVEEAELSALLPRATILDTSLQIDGGTKGLEEKITELVFGGAVRQERESFLTNERHQNLLILAKTALEDAIAATLQGDALDFIEVDVRHAWELLGEIIGETVTEDIIDEVFARFCLGK